jgi:hypothetical protein
MKRRMMRVVRYYDGTGWRIALHVSDGRKYASMLPLKNPIVIRKLDLRIASGLEDVQLHGEPYPIDRALKIFREYAEVRGQDLSHAVKLILEVTDEQDNVSRE